jgi:hypothetical protein
MPKLEEGLILRLALDEIFKFGNRAWMLIVDDDTRQPEKMTNTG